jgi:predicted RNase H-like HicB family nuclease
MKLSVRLIHNYDEFIANCPELDINCYGSDREEAIRRIKKVINFYVDSAKELGLDVESLTEISVEGEKKQELSEVAINPSTKTIN